MKGKILSFDKPAKLMLIKTDKAYRKFHNKDGNLIDKNCNIVFHIEQFLRSLDQNAFYWAFLEWLSVTYWAELMDFVDPSPRGLHEFFKRMARYKRAVPVQFFDGDSFSTAVLSKYYFGVYLENVVFYIVITEMHLDISEWENKYIEYKNSQAENLI